MLTAKNQKQKANAESHEAKAPPGNAVSLEANAPPGNAVSQEANAPPGNAPSQEANAPPGNAPTQEANAPPGSADNHEAKAPPGSADNHEAKAPPGSADNHEAKAPPGQKAKDPQGRKWQITINNPIEKGFSHANIKQALLTLLSLVYFCMADEKGNDKETFHTHIFIACSSPVRFSTIKKLFKAAHIERAQGTAQENRDYIAKTGKWVETEKSKTSLENSFEEWGEMPKERNGFSLEAVILERIQDGATNAEILREFPSYLKNMHSVEYVRQILREEECRSKNREVQVTYVSGPTGVGKSYNLMKENQFDTYRITDFIHPWDFYAGQGTVIMEEYASSLKIGEMLNVLDVYPLVLRARYANKVAMFDKVFIVSNIELFEQYPNVQSEQPEVFRAFLRRIHKVIVYTAYQQFNEYSMEEYKAISRGYHYAKIRLEYRSTTYPDYLNSDVPTIETSEKTSQPGKSIQQAIPRIESPGKIKVEVETETEIEDAVEFEDEIGDADL